MDQPSPLPSSSAPPPLPQAKTSALAIVALISGLFGFLILPAIAGLVCGLVAGSRIRASGGRLKGQGIALAGVIVSAVMLALVPVMAILAGLMLPALAKAKTKAQVVMSMNNVKQLCLGAVLYSTDHNDKLPAAATWCDTITPLVGSPKTFQRPADRTGGRCGYGYNARIAGMKTAEVTVPNETVMFFELEQPGWNTSGGAELLRKPSNRGDPIIVGFADGHAEAMRSEQLGRIRWGP